MGLTGRLSRTKVLHCLGPQLTPGGGWSGPSAAYLIVVSSWTGFYSLFAGRPENGRHLLKRTPFTKTDALRGKRTLLCSRQKIIMGDWKGRPPAQIAWGPCLPRAVAGAGRRPHISLWSLRDNILFAGRPTWKTDAIY